jgi:hypothetical protein
MNAIRPLKIKLLSIISLEEIPPERKRLEERSIRNQVKKMQRER